MHKCYNNRKCTVTVALTFNILVIFSFSLSLVALTLTSLSLFLIWSNHQTTTANRHRHWSLANCLIKSSDQHEAWSNRRSPPPRSLSDHWSPLISRCLISGFRVGWVMIWVLDWMSWFSLIMLVGWVMMVAGCGVIVGSVGSVIERGSEKGNNKKL